MKFTTSWRITFARLDSIKGRNSLLVLEQDQFVIRVGQSRLCVAATNWSSNKGFCAHLQFRPVTILNKQTKITRIKHGNTAETAFVGGRLSQGADFAGYFMHRESTHKIKCETHTENQKKTQSFAYKQQQWNSSTRTDTHVTYRPLYNEAETPF